MAFLLGIMGLLIYFFLRGAIYDPPADMKYDQYVMQNHWPDWQEKCSEQWWFERRPDTAKAWRDWQDAADIRMDKGYRKKDNHEFLEFIRTRKYDVYECLNCRDAVYKTLSDDEKQSLKVLRQILKIPDGYPYYKTFNIDVGLQKYSGKGYELGHVDKKTEELHEVIAMAYRGRIPHESVAAGMPMDQIWTDTSNSKLPSDILFKQTRHRLTHYKFMLWYNQELKKHGFEYDMYLVRWNGTFVDPNNLDEVVKAYRYTTYEMGSSEYGLKATRKCSHFIWEPMIRFKRDPDENIWFNTYDRAWAPPPLSSRR